MNMRKKECVWRNVCGKSCQTFFRKGEKKELVKRVHAEGSIPQYSEGVSSYGMGYDSDGSRPFMYSEEGLLAATEETSHTEGYESVQKVAEYKREFQSEDDKIHRYPADIITDLSLKIVPLLEEAAIELLHWRDSEYIQLAVALLEDALRYDNIFPHARGGGDELIYKATKNLKVKEK